MLVTTFVAAWGATEFRTRYLPHIPALRAWVPVVLVALLVSVFYTRYWAYALAVAVVLSMSTSAFVNPLVKGMGALDHSRAAQVVRRVDARDVEPRDGRWASDTRYADALLNGQGVNSLSSFNDPVSSEGWRILDPSGAQESSWNRFAFLTFVWDPSSTQPSFELEGEDWVKVHIDPCDQRLSQLRLRAVVSSTPLDAPCLSARAHFLWFGLRYTVYDRAIAGATAPPPDTSPRGKSAGRVAGTS